MQFYWIALKWFLKSQKSLSVGNILKNHLLQRRIATTAICEDQGALRRQEQQRGFDHIRTCTPCQNSNKADRFEVLHSCTRHNLLSPEAMLIAKHRPILNTQLGLTKEPLFPYRCIGRSHPHSIFRSFLV